MKKGKDEGGTKNRVGRWLGALALAGGAVGAWLMLRPTETKETKPAGARRGGGGGRAWGRGPEDVWARPGMNVVFRAELMPGRNRAERTYRVASLRPSGRVTLDGFAGEHAEGEFEPLRFD